MIAIQFFEGLCKRVWAEASTFCANRGITFKWLIQYNLAISRTDPVAVSHGSVIHVKFSNEKIGQRCVFRRIFKNTLAQADIINIAIQSYNCLAKEAHPDVSKIVNHTCE